MYFYTYQKNYAQDELIPVLFTHGCFGQRWYCLEEIFDTVLEANQRRSNSCVVKRGDAQLSSQVARVYVQLVCWFVIRHCNAFRVVLVMFLWSAFKLCFLNPLPTIDPCFLAYVLPVSNLALN